MEQLITSYVPAINKALEKYIPRQLTKENIQQINGFQSYEWDFEALNEAVSPIWDLLDRGGKKWRSVLFLLIAEVFSKKVEDVIDFTVIIEVLHNGSLIIDDIEDNSQYRRGKRCLHILKGLDVALNSGNLMYYLPLKVLQDRKSSLNESILLKCYELYSEEMLNVHLGQGLDIVWHSKTSYEGKEPTVANYLKMCANKTGALARLSAKLSATVCGATNEQIEAIGNFAESIGIAFQIQDDMLNIETNGFLSNSKGGIGEDIHEGKRTIMVIHCFDNAPQHDVRRLKEILAMKTNDQKLIVEAIEIIQSMVGRNLPRKQLRNWLKMHGSY